MSRVAKSQQIWFRVFIVSGILLGVVLMVQTVVTYVYVSGNLVLQEARADADRKAASLERAMRLVNPADPEAMGSVLADAMEDWDETVGWFRVLDRGGDVLAEGGASDSSSPTPMEAIRQDTQGSGPYYETRTTELGTVLVSISRVRRLTPGFIGGRGQVTGGARGGPAAPGRGASPPQISVQGETPATPGPFGNNANPVGGLQAAAAQAPAFLEIAVVMESVSASFRPLRRNLVIGVTAAFALLGTVFVIGIRFPHYLRGKQLEGQLELARAVQGNLLPTVPPHFRNAEIAADCTPVSQVGGDFYDVFELPGPEMGIMLGDVSGKGISAAPLMGFIHGAAHASSWTDSPEDHELASSRLNELLHKKTAMDRFVTLFWGYFEEGASVFRYVNAGHCPPVLFRSRSGGNQIVRLEDGGPVLGAFPGSRYGQAVVAIEDGDLLVLYSDGVVEGTNAGGEEFGESRILSGVRSRWGQTVSEIRDGILADLKAFRRGESPQDDQTLVVVRIAPDPVGEPGGRDRSAAVPVA